MSSDLKATNESARCWEKISSYIKRADMFYSLFKPQLSTFEGHFCVFLLCFWGDDTVHVPHILVKGILKASYHVHETLWKFSHANIFFLYMRLLLKTILFLSPSSCKHFFYLQTIYFGVYNLCKKFISKFFNTTSPPRPKNNGPSLRISIQ